MKLEQEPKKSEGHILADSYLYKSGRTRKKTRSRRKGTKAHPKLRKNLGLTSIFLAIILFFCFRTVTYRYGNILESRLDNVFIVFVSFLSQPLFSLMGQAAYALPFFLLFVGISQFWDFFHLTRRRNIIRAFLSIPLLAALSTGLSKIFGWAPAQGGLIGLSYFDNLKNIGGPIMGWLFGMILIIIVGCFLWRITAPFKKIWRFLKKAYPMLKRFAKKTIKLAQDAHDRKIFPPKADHGSQSSSLPPLKTPKSWQPSVFGQPTETTDRASLIPTTKSFAASKEDEAEFLPLPDPDIKNPLPLEILPEPSDFNDFRDQLLTEIPIIQQKVAEIVKRTSHVNLRTAEISSALGLNSIALEYLRADGQSVPVRNVEKAVQDIGIAIGRAPVRIDIGTTVRVELPLLPEERCYVPIKPLLREISPSAPLSTSPTYLIGRRQDGMPFELPIKNAKHILVGGGTGGGKSVLLHSIIFGIIFRYPPSQVRIALADHKAIEFSRYRGLPHLWQDVVTSPAGFTALVENLWNELQKRKQRIIQEPDIEFPLLLTIVDEFSGYDSNKLIRLIAEARALNMFFILATQHPTHEVISTSIKANLLTGIAFKTKTKSGSQLIIDCSDAVSLQGRGDCLVLSESGVLTRVQVSWVTSSKDRKESDIDALVQFLKAKIQNA